MSQIDKIAEAVNRELARAKVSVREVGVRAPKVALRTLDRMGYRAHKYPAPDRPGVVGPEDPQWSLGVGTLQLDHRSWHLYLDGHPIVGMNATLDEYQELAEGILAAVELARELEGGEQS